MPHLPSPSASVTAQEHNPPLSQAIRNNLLLPEARTSFGKVRVPLSAVERGIQQARLEGDLDDLTFPVIYERVVPGANDEHPNGVYEHQYEALSFKTLKELKVAITQYGPNFPYTMGIIRNLADGHRLIPVDWQAESQISLSPAQFLQFKTWWIDGAKTKSRHNQVHNIAITQDQLLGRGDWEGVHQQIGMTDQAVAQLRRVCLNTWEKIETEGKTPSSFSKNFQGPTEPYTKFVSRLQDTIKKQVANYLNKFLLMIMLMMIAKGLLDI